MTQLQRITIAPTQISNNQISLDSGQQHYLSRVLRLRKGDRFIAIDGQGHWWLSTLGEDEAEAHILEAIDAKTELPVAVTLIIAMPKGSGMDEVVRQVTELGVATIVPVVSDRTLLNPSSQKIDRWRRIAQEAAEQSERQIVPEIVDPIKLSAALQTWASLSSSCYLCEARGDYPHLLSCLTTFNEKRISNSFKISNVYGSASPLPAIPQGSALVIAIGPEGGWTEQEIEEAIAAGYQPVSLGKRVLRAVTAPLVALSLTASVVEGMPQPHESV